MAPSHDQLARDCSIARTRSYYLRMAFSELVSNQLDNEQDQTLAVMEQTTDPRLRIGRSRHCSSIDWHDTTLRQLRSLATTG